MTLNYFSLFLIISISYERGQAWPVHVNLGYKAAWNRLNMILKYSNVILGQKIWLPAWNTPKINRMAGMRLELGLELEVLELFGWTRTRTNTGTRIRTGTRINVNWKLIKCNFLVVELMFGQWYIYIDH